MNNNQWLKLWLLISFSIVIVFSQVKLPANTPDEVECLFKYSSTVKYSNIDKGFGGEAKPEKEFKFSIINLNTNKPMIEGDYENGELQILKMIKERIYLAENTQLGLNIITLYLDSRKVTMTKQYGLLAADGENPFVYSWVGELNY